jgi:hypothetical protein
MTSLCLVTCYFGSWPGYIDLFLESCRHNPSVDFLLISDCGPLSDAPPNVRVVPATLDDVRDRIRERLGLDPAIVTPYSLCDFKPTYGILLDDLLDGYDFWGCTDVDLIYGNIRSFITEELLSSNDVISARAPYLTGFFFLFRNENRLNGLYRQSADCERVLQSERHFSFTECNYQWDALISGASIFDLDTEIESITEVIRREEQAGRLRCHFADLGREVMDGTEFVWDDGRLVEFYPNRSVERMLLHFVILKNQFYFTFPDWETVPHRYHVRPTGFYRDSEATGLNRLRALPVTAIARKWWSQTTDDVTRRLLSLTRSSSA